MEGGQDRDWEVKKLVKQLDNSAAPPLRHNPLLQIGFNRTKRPAHIQSWSCPGSPGLSGGTGMLRTPTAQRHAPGQEGGEGVRAGRMRVSQGTLDAAGS